MDAIPVYYSPAMVSQTAGSSPSAAKPAPVVESWRNLGIPLRIIPPTPVARDQIAAAHSPDRVDRILAGKAINGFGNASLEVAASLPHTSGAMLSGAREAIRNRRVAVAPCSGFHHATYAEPQGYCTFNGLMIAAIALHATSEARKVGILDFDEHYGNGTDDIIARLKLRFVTHFTAGNQYHQPVHAASFLERIPEIVGTMADCDVILYQAGADPHIDDPLGGWLTDAQLYERDLLVFQTAARLGVPIVWNLAGGYQTPLRKVLDIHDNTMRACAAVYLRPPA